MEYALMWRWGGDGGAAPKMVHFPTTLPAIMPNMNTVEPLIAATFTAKVRWPLLGGGRYSEVYYKFSCLKKGRACDRNPV